MVGIEELEQEAFAVLDASGTTTELRDLELKYLGKSGLYTGLLRLIGQLPPEEKPLFGQKVNEAKARLQTALDEKARILKRQEQAVEFEADRID
ncbi:MAG: phenylalanine--tRNA ligase subunit alpha, partial [Fimbriimonadaceae bacterium]